MLYFHKTEIEKQLLVQLWIAQGYIQSSNRDEQLEDMGDRYFEESVSRLLLKKKLKKTILMID